MIYGDYPVKWNERNEDEGDPLGLNSYTLVPDIYAINQSSNLYAYGMNNPVLYVDPDGDVAFLAVIAIGAGAGLIAGAVAGVVTQAVNGQKISLKAVGVSALDGAVQGVMLTVPGGATVKAASGTTKVVAAQTVTKTATKINTVVQSKLQHEFRHAVDFGIKGNWNKSSGELFNKAIIKHVNSISKPISGTYRGTIKVKHYYDPKTGLNVMVDSSGDLVGGWKLSSKQIEHLLKTGNVQ